MKYTSREEWKQEIRNTFKRNGYDWMAQNIQAEAFHDMHNDCKLHELPDPIECYEAEVDAANN